MTDGNSLPGAERAPRSATRFGYAVLFLFAVVGAIFGSTHGIRIATLVLLACIVIGFMLSLFAFDRIARSRDRLWRLVGAILSIATLTAIVAIFGCVLIYLASGHPSFIGKLLQ